MAAPVFRQRRGGLRARPCVRIATFRRSPTGRLHMIPGDRPGVDTRRGVWQFVQTTGWWDGQDRIELVVDGLVYDRWTTTDAMEIDVFRRMLHESLVQPRRRPLPGGGMR